MSPSAHKARKRFGQNFLIDEEIIQRIIDAIHPRPGELIIEIGPGQAALSGPLLEAGVNLHLIEIDRDLAAVLQRQLGGSSSMRLHQGDALRTDFSRITDGQPFRLVGNLPYNISTPVLFHVLKWHGLIEDMHFMLQKEVVERMAASPGGKAWGRLSIMCQYHCEVTPLFTVAPVSFSPVPRVHSAVVRLVPHKRPPVEVSSFPNFSKLVGQAFSMRRKTLRNSLRSLLDADRIQSAGIDPGLRPEALSLQQFATLAELIE
jgi:16S rRNA (adenine1518-N6/adenine1519-N6)-dimethyltransferase